MPRYEYPAEALPGLVRQERVAILLPLDERPEVVILCCKGRYCVALEQSAPNISGRYALAHNWQALEADARHEWQKEGDPYEEGACVRVSWQLERRARWNLSQQILVQCQYAPDQDAPEKPSFWSRALLGARKMVRVFKS